MVHINIIVVTVKNELTARRESYSEINWANCLIWWLVECRKCGEWWWCVLGGCGVLHAIMIGDIFYLYNHSLSTYFHFHHEDWLIKPAGKNETTMTSYEMDIIRFWSSPYTSSGNVSQSKTNHWHSINNWFFIRFNTSKNRMHPVHERCFWKRNMIKKMRSSTLSELCAS